MARLARLNSPVVSRDLSVAICCRFASELSRTSPHTSRRRAVTRGSPRAWSWRAMNAETSPRSTTFFSTASSRARAYAAHPRASPPHPASRPASVAGAVRGSPPAYGRRRSPPAAGWRCHGGQRPRARAGVPAQGRARACLRGSSGRRSAQPVHDRDRASARATWPVPAGPRTAVPAPGPTRGCPWRRSPGAGDTRRSIPPA